MSERHDDGFLSGLGVCVLVWNSFTHDARVLREVGSLTDQGARVRVVCIRQPGPLPAREITESGIEIVRVEVETWLSRLFGSIHPGLGTLAQELAGTVGMFFRSFQFHPDVVHGNDANTLIPSWLCARLSRAKIVYDAHEISADREGYAGRAWIVRTIERTFGTRADAWITTTSLRAHWFEANYGWSGVHVVQNRPEYSAARSTLIRERLSLPEERFVVLYQGGLQPGRGLKKLIHAARGLAGVDLVLIGGGNQREELENLADGADNVHFVGQVPLAELPLWTASADVGVQVLRNTCLNHYTTDSNKLFEYVMGGVPVIASDFPEIRTIVSEHDLGILVDPESVEEIRAAIERFAFDTDFRARCRSNALQARQELDWTSQEDSFFTAYRQALAAN